MTVTKTSTLHRRYLAALALVISTGTALTVREQSEHVNPANLTVKPKQFYITTPRPIFDSCPDGLMCASYKDSATGFQKFFLTENGNRAKLRNHIATTADSTFCFDDCNGMMDGYLKRDSVLKLFDSTSTPIRIVSP